MEEKKFYVKREVKAPEASKSMVFACYSKLPKFLNTPENKPNIERDIAMFLLEGYPVSLVVKKIKDIYVEKRPRNYRIVK